MNLVENNLDGVDFIIGINIPTYDKDNYSLMFYCKLKNKKYSDCKWIKKSVFDANPEIGHKLIDAFQNAVNSGSLSKVHFIDNLYKPDQIQLNEAFYHPEKILSIKDDGSSVYYFVKWEDLPLTQATWEVDVDRHLIEQYQKILENPNPIEMQKTGVFQNPDSFIPINESPIYKNSNKLTAYQINGYNWLIDKWHYNHNSILADQSGMGKTIQCIAFIDGINRITNFHGPYLVITALSNVNKWEQEFKEWTDLNVLNFSGDDKQIEIMSEYCIYADSKRSSLKFDIVIIPIESFEKRYSILANIKWLCCFFDEIIIDLKKNCPLLKYMATEITTDHTIILTKVDVSTLKINHAWYIFNFLENDTFQSLEDFKKKYEGKSGFFDPEKYKVLAENYVLRRTLKEIDFTKMKNGNILIEAEPTSQQIDAFKSLFLDNCNNILYHANLAHLVFQLRQICNHPFILNHKYKENNFDIHSLINSSGKMIVLDKLIMKFRNSKCRILILSKMHEMIDLIEIYLKQNGILFYRLNEPNNNVSPQRNSHSIFLSSISKFNHDNINPDVIIIYDSTIKVSANKKLTFRLFTRDTIEKDLLFRFFINGDLTPANDEEIDKLMRRNAFLAFNSNIDMNFFSEPLEKTWEYRTQPDFSNINSLDYTFSNSNFWINLFQFQSIENINKINISKDDIQKVAKSLLNYGCYETKRKLAFIKNIEILISALVYVLYRHFDKPHQKTIKKYINKVFSISGNTIITKEIIKRSPFNDHSYIQQLFHNDLPDSVNKISTNDRIYTILSFMSQPAFNSIGFKFGQSMNIPPFWNEFYDYTLLYTCYKYDMSKADEELLKEELKKANLFFETKLQIEWIKKRIALVIHEAEMYLPNNFFPSTIPLEPLKWQKFYRPNYALKIENRIHIKRALLVLYLFGFPTKHQEQPTFWLTFRNLMHLTPLPIEIIIVIVYSIIEAAAKFNSYLSQFLNDIKPIRTLDLSWIDENILVALSKQLVFFDRIRDISANNSLNTLPDFNRWSIAPHWWDKQHDWKFINIISKEGFLTFCSMKNLNNCKYTLKQDEDINHSKLIELHTFQPLLPDALNNLSFMFNIDTRINRMMELIRIIDNPITNLLIDKLPNNQNYGISIIQIGKPDLNKYPIGYKATRFYRDLDSNKTYFFDCSVESCQTNKPIFVITEREHTNETNRSVKANSVMQVYKMFLDMLAKNSIPLPPPFLDGYDFFGFKQAFSAYYHLTQASP